MYAIRNKNTLIFVSKDRYQTERGAKIALGRNYDKSLFEVIDTKDDPMVERINLMSKEKYMEPLNTPVYCSPAHESYWSM